MKLACLSLVQAISTAVSLYWADLFTICIAADTAACFFALAQLDLFAGGDHGQVFCLHMETTEGLLCERKNNKSQVDISEMLLSLAYYSRIFFQQLTIEPTFVRVIPSLPQCHLKTTSKRAKFETPHPFCLLFRIGVLKEFYQNVGRRIS